jgi:hypothetical protein
VARHALSIRAYPLPDHGLDEMSKLRKLFVQLAVTGVKLPPVSMAGKGKKNLFFNP